MIVVKYVFIEFLIIDICDLVGDDFVRCQVVVDVIGCVVCEVGFFYIIGYGIDLVLIVGICEVVKQIFVLLMEEKMNYYIGYFKSYKGYVLEGEEIYGFGKLDYKEVFDIGFQVVDDYLLVFVGMLLIGVNEWFDLLDFCVWVLVYYDVVFVFGYCLFDVFVFVFGLLEGYFKLMVICLLVKLWLIYYLFDVSVEDVFGIGVYIDYECFILLFVDQFGFEVFNEESVWIDVFFVKNVVGEEVFVINIGDMLEVFSVGIFVVIVYWVCKVLQEWYFFLLFFVCDYYMLICLLLIFFVVGEVGEYQEFSIGEYMWSQVL